MPLSDVELVSAKGSLVYEIVDEEKTPTGAAQQALIHALLGVNVSFSRFVLTALAYYKDV